MKVIKLLSITLLLSGCKQMNTGIAIPEVGKPINDIEKVINDIQIGMTKKQVISILGYPLTTEADNYKECLSYPLTTEYRSNFRLLFERGILTKYNKTQNCVEIFE